MFDQCRCALLSLYSLPQTGTASLQMPRLSFCACSSACLFCASSFGSVSFVKRSSMHPKPARIIAVLTSTPSTVTLHTLRPYLSSFVQLHSGPPWMIVFSLAVAAFPSSWPRSGASYPAILTLIFSVPRMKWIVSPSTIFTGLHGSAVAICANKTKAQIKIGHFIGCY